MVSIRILVILDMANRASSELSKIFDLRRLVENTAFDTKNKKYANHRRENRTDDFTENPNTIKKYGK